MAGETVTQALERVAQGNDLSAPIAAAVLARIMHGDVAAAQIAGLLIGLRTKGETVDEVVGFARTMRELAVPVRPSSAPLLDTAGTGGGRGSFNVSTTAALIAAGAGCRVAKHGNRSATSLSGSADLLEALGVRIELAPEAIARCIDEVGFGFMFAPAHHQATRYVIPVRKQLAVRTVFNFLGPLTNPAGATRQVIGVSDGAFLEVIAGALAALGSERALIVHSHDGMDEISAAAPTDVIELDEGRISRYTLTPQELGFEPVPAEAITGGTPAQNADTTRSVLAGEESPARSVSLINAGAAIYAAGVSATIAEGVALAREATDSGAAARTLAALVALSDELGAS
jgi:anthranilate phosphoribosyltransferase